MTTQADKKKEMTAAELADEEVLDMARRILSEGYVCDNCLGRQFARVSTGMTNRERGHFIKEKLKEQELLEAEVSEKCWVCNGLFEHVEAWAWRAVAALRDYEFKTFLVGTRMSGLLAENEEMLWELTGAAYAEPLKSEFNREVGKILQRLLNKRVDFQTPDILILIDLNREAVELQVRPVFIYGRYRKLVRGMPQTRWLCRSCRGAGCERCNFTGKMYPESVEELIKAPVVEEFEAEDMILHGCGREDIDARMLGRGRPFVAEVVAPRRRTVNLQRLEEKIKESSGGKVEVFGLRYVTKDAVEIVKNVKAAKTYRFKLRLGAKVEEKHLRAALEGLKGVIRQRTPRRVVHRRADIVREREVYDICLIEFGKHPVVEIKCESGLYVKELVSGDEGRTKPSLSELLGVTAEVFELDVLDVEFELASSGDD
ncbi:MAG: tRNA U54 and U55 pseudouridine synthase Pus10 [Candidatus Alkanophagales archaeon MCA70_species_2]|nr:tRNA U54 and U55 pseudouridine synthase Pus10 [Candidatus Alkanophaga liquidiphilum]